MLLFLNGSHPTLKNDWTATIWFGLMVQTMLFPQSLPTCQHIRNQKAEPQTPSSRCPASVIESTACEAINTCQLNCLMRSFLIGKNAVLSSVQDKSAMVDLVPTWIHWPPLSCLLGWDLAVHPPTLIQLPLERNPQHWQEGKKEIIITIVHVNIPRGIGRRKEKWSSNYPLIIIFIIVSLIFVS